MTSPPPISAEPRGLCIDCNYPLTGLASTACPECGRPFDPANPGSMNMTGPIRALERPWLRPVKWLAPVSRIGAIAAALFSILLCGMYAPSLALLGLIYVAVAVPYLIHRTLRQAVVRRHELPEAMLAADDVQVRKARTAFLVTTLLLVLRLPFYAAFFVSLPALHRVAVREYEQTPQDAPRPRALRVGLFPVQEVQVGYCGATFHVWPAGGLSYFPDGWIPYYWSTGAIPIFPGWYVPLR